MLVESTVCLLRTYPYHRIKLFANIISALIITILLCRYHYPHYTDKETKASRFMNLPEIIHIVNGRILWSYFTTPQASSNPLCLLAPRAFPWVPLSLSPLPFYIPYIFFRLLLIKKSCPQQKATLSHCKQQTGLYWGI